MQITLYRSFLCPRCFLAKKYLLEIAKKKTNLDIKEIDIIRHPLKTWDEGIRLIPALKIDDKIISGFFLNKLQILHFIEEAQKGKK